MTATFRTLLVHGYTGSPELLAPLAARLEHRFSATVATVTLPGHGEKTPPSFDIERFAAHLEEALSQRGFSSGSFVAVGHSTGGLLLLAALAKLGLAPGLLVLAASPKSVDGAALSRWETQRTGAIQVPFSEGVKLASWINRTVTLVFDAPFPVLLLQGERDEILAPGELHRWNEGVFAGPVRTVVLPEGNHHLFTGAAGPLAVEVVERAIADWAMPLTSEQTAAVQALRAAEPEAAAFLARSPASARHLALCPSALRLAGGEPSLTPEVGTEPVFLNVEITTRCNACCLHCARSLSLSGGKEQADMAPEAFARLLDLLPHAYRVTLVGLGETLLHPQAVDFVKEVARRGRRPALVTNGSLLTPVLSEALLGAGLRSIAFSLDAISPKSQELRPGPPIEEILKNIRGFMELAAQDRSVSTAIFSAISPRNLDQIEPLADLAVELGVHVLMLSDLNFAENQPGSLAKNLTPELRQRVRKGIAYAFSKQLPVLTVRALEEFGLASRYTRGLLAPASQLYERSARHTHCASPWQTLAVDVHGNALLCDCQPGAPIGNLFTQPLHEIWNGPQLAQYRESMRGETPPVACAACPRF